MKKAALYFSLCINANLWAQSNFFEQDFDDLSTLTWSQHNDSLITTATEPFPHTKFNHIRGGISSNAILDTTYTSGSISNRSLKVSIPDSVIVPSHYGRSISYYLGGQVIRGNPTIDTTYFSGGHEIRDSYSADQNEMYLRYHIKLDANWLFNSEHIVKVPGLAGTYNSGAGGMWPDLPDSLGWSARMLWGQGPEHSTSEVSPISYVYHLDQKCGNTFQNCGTGDHFPSDDNGAVRWEDLTRYQTGEWHRVEQRIKMNDLGNNNGLTEVWIDGKLDTALSTYQLRFTSADSIKINRLWADIYYGGKYLSPANNDLYLDDGARLAQIFV